MLPKQGELFEKGPDPEAIRGHYVKLYRKSIDSRVWSDPLAWYVFTWCLMKANWKTGYFRGTKIPRGAFATGRSTAMDELEVSVKVYRNRLKKLEEWGLITVDGANQFSVITVCNYEAYQSEQTPRGQQGASKGPARGQRGATIEEEKEEQGGKQPPRDPYHHEDPLTEDQKGSAEFVTLWQQRRALYLERQHSPMPQVKADYELMELARRPIEKAIADLKRTLASSANGITILDSGHDYGRNGKPSGKAEVKRKPITELQKEMNG